MKSESKNQLSPRWRRWLLRLGLGFVLYSVIGFFLLPPIIKWQLTKRLPEITKRQATVRQVKLNPWTLSFAIRGLTLNEPDGAVFASWDEFYVNFQTSSLFRWAWTFKEIRLEKPFGEVILFKDGRLNFANMFESPTNTPPAAAQPASVPRVNIFQLVVTNGFVAFEDRTRRSLFRTEYRPINLTLHDFTTRPGAETPYSFRAESDSGRSVNWEGDLSLEPLRSFGRLELTGIRLSRYQPYLEDFTRAIVTNGLADVKFEYRFVAGANGSGLDVSNGVVHLEQLQVLDPETAETVAALRGLDVRDAVFSLQARAVRLGSVKVTEASLLTRRKRDGHLNLVDLIALPAPATNANPAPGKPERPFEVKVDDFSIEKTAVRFEDMFLHTPFQTELKPIEVRVQHFTTATGADANYRFHLATEAAEQLEGIGSFSINPVRSSGEVKVAAIDLKKYLPYVEDFFRGQIASGKVEVRVPYRFALATNGIKAGVTNLGVTLTDVEVLMPENKQVVTHIDEIGFEDVDASLEDRRGRVGLFKGRGGSVVLRRGKDGRLNLLGLLAVTKTNLSGAPPSDHVPAPSTNPQTPASAFALGGWVLNLDELSLKDYTLQLEDLVPAKPAKFLIDQLSLSVKGASTLSNTPITASLSLRLNETSSVAISGQAKLAPLFADATLAVTNLDLRAAQPYIDPFIGLTIVSGSFNTTSRIGYGSGAPSSSQCTFAGRLNITNFVTTDQVASKDFVRWDDFTISGVDAGFNPNYLKIQEIRLVRPNASARIGADHRANLSQILKSDRAGTNQVSAVGHTEAPAPGPSHELFPIQVGSLALEQASFSFIDESIQPQANFALEGITGTIKGLSSATNASAEIELAGKTGPQSTFSIMGGANPLATEMRADLTVSNANLQLMPFTGYLEKYAGHPLRKGRLSTWLHYRIDGKKLEADNKIQVDQLTLGPRNNSPDAPNLPIKLGVALLKDSQGRIQLDVPVNGSLNDPQFRIGPIVLKVIVNTLVKAAASPFKLLGALVGGGEELSFIEFTPGSTNAVGAELEKLDKLAKALAQRPALNLEIEGGVDLLADRDALARQKLRDQLKSRRLQELSGEGQVLPVAEGFVLEPADYDRLLRAAFVDQFGTNIAAVLQTNLPVLNPANRPAANSTVTTASKRSLWQRVTGLFGGGPATQPKAEHRLDKADRQALNLAPPETMEALLTKEIPIPDEALRQLLDARARRVQTLLVQNGQVAADRLLLVAPAPLAAGARGESRVKLSLN